MPAPDQRSPAAGTLTRRLVTNTGANFGFRLFTIFLSFLSVPLIVSGVGAEGYGVLLLAESVMGYFSLLDAGVPAGTVKYVAEYDAREDHDTVNQIVSSSLVFFLAAGGLVALVVFCFVALGGVGVFNVSSGARSEAEAVLYLAAAWALIAWPLGTLGQTLDGLQRYPENRMAMAVGGIAGRLLAIGAALSVRSLEWVFLASNAGILLTASLQWRALRRALPTLRLGIRYFRPDTLRMIFGYSLWMTLGRLAALLLYQTDRIILGMFLPVASLTIHQVVTMPFRYIQQFSGLYNSALTPAVSAVEAQQGRQGLDRFIYTASRYSNAFVAGLALLGAYLSPAFIRLWMGEEYVQYAWIAQVACAFQMLWQANSTLMRVFYGAGKVKRITMVALAVAVLNVPLGVWWAREVGVAGVVFATIAAGVLAVPLQYLFALPELEVDRRRYFLESVVRGQWTIWMVALLLLPLGSRLASIDTWPVLIGAAAAISAVQLALVLWLTVEPRHQRQLLRRPAPVA